MAVSSSVRPSPNHSISHNFCSARPFDRHGSSVHSLHVECRLGFASKSRDKKMEGLTLSRNRTQKVCNNGASSRPSFPTAFRIRCDGAHGSEPAFELASEQIKKTQSSSEVVPSNTYSDSISAEQQPYTETGGGEGNGGAGDNGKFGFGGDGDSSGEGDEFVQEEEEGFGSLLNSEEVGKQVQSRGITLPPDMAEAAQTVGIRSLVLTQFMDLQGAKWPLGAAIRGSSMLRNRMLADQSFLFKLLTEIAIDSGCATFAEVQKRGDDFWNEFELYMADLVVGVVVDVTLVCMLAPFIQFRRTAPATGTISQFSRAIQFLPSSIFEAATPGRKFSVQQRIASYFYKGIQYGAVGFTCGIIGQGVANSIMLLKRKMKKSDEKDVAVPPLVRSAALWGVFLAVSSNTRYQIVNGLERVVEGSSVAKRLPLVAMAFTICIRFANNTYGGMQFVDWARWSGVQ